MTLDVALKVIHILSASVLFGTGLGIAFFMLMAHRTGDPAAIARTARVVVVADMLFTATAVVVQALSGVALAWVVGYSLLDSWIVVSIALYVLVGACWLPVVWIQLRLRDLAAQAARQSGALPDRYARLFRVWFWLGWPAFAGVVAIFAIMVQKPQFW
jgi:uncharacterized membrane protein